MGMIFIACAWFALAFGVPALALFLAAVGVIVTFVELAMMD